MCLNHVKNTRLDQFDIETNLPKIESEIKQIGILKILNLAKHSKNIDEAMKLYISDMRISRFFWRHIRRLEVNSKAVLLNYFFGINDLEIFIWKTEKSINEDAKTIKSKKVVNKDFAMKYLKYSGDESARDTQTIKEINSLIYNYKVKNSGVDIIDFIKKISLGKYMDFITLIDPDKVSVYLEVKKYFPLKHLVSLRNEISHFHLLCEEHSKKT